MGGKGSPWLAFFVLENKSPKFNETAPWPCCELYGKGRRCMLHEHIMMCFLKFHECIMIRLNIDVHTGHFMFFILFPPYIHHIISPRLRKNIFIGSLHTLHIHWILMHYLNKPKWVYIDDSENDIDWSKSRFILYACDIPHSKQWKAMFDTLSKLPFFMCVLATIVKVVYAYCIHYSDCTTVKLFTMEMYVLS